MNQINNGLACAFDILDELTPSDMGLKVLKAPTSNEPPVVHVKPIVTHIPSEFRDSQSGNSIELCKLIPSKIARKLVYAITTVLDPLDSEPHLPQWSEEKKQALLHKLGKGYMPRAWINGVKDAITLLYFAERLARQDSDVVRAPTSYQNIWIYTLKVPQPFKAFSPWIKFKTIRERNLLSFIKWNSLGTFPRNSVKYLRAPECWSQKTDVVTFITHPVFGLKQWYAGEDPYNPTCPPSKFISESDWTKLSNPHLRSQVDVEALDDQWVLCSEDSHKVYTKGKERKQVKF